jgi:ABC-type transporter Mla subunit MlaD
MVFLFTSDDLIAFGALAICEIIGILCLLGKSPMRLVTLAALLVTTPALSQPQPPIEDQINGAVAQITRAASGMANQLSQDQTNIRTLQGLYEAEKAKVADRDKTIEGLKKAPPAADTPKP